MRITRYQVVALVGGSIPASPEMSAQIRPSALRVDAQDRDELLRWVRAATTAQRVVMRSVVVLLAGAGWTNARIATELGVSRRTVALWKQRYQVAGCRTLLVDAPGRGRKPGRN